MFSYSIETSLKSIASEVKTNEFQKAFKKIKNSHDLNNIFDLLVKYEICSDKIVSKDFLEYTTSNFNRYPSQVEAARRKILKESGSSVISLSMITYFDDFIMELDDCLWNLIGNKNASILDRAINQFENYEGRAFFHQNFPAIVKVQNLPLSEFRYGERWNLNNASICKEIGSAELMRFRLNYGDDGKISIESLTMEEIVKRKSAKKFTIPRKAGEAWRG